MQRDIFQAIANPIRRAIIDQLSLQTMTAIGIDENLNTKRQAVLKHLRILRECQLVKQAPKGYEAYDVLEIKK